jgi:imidazolonepropionase
MNGLSVQEAVDVLIDGERVTKIAPHIRPQDVDQVIDARGGVVLPGLVDAHTHSVFAGTREEEFLARLQGLPYTGGGILSTTRSVALASEEELLRLARPYLLEMMAAGTTTVEIKSGYGLSLEGETKLLSAIRHLRRAAPARIVSTFLGAHAFPEGMTRDDYILSIITQMIPAVRRRRLAQFCDVFCDEGFYTVAETRTILRAARGAGLKLKLHADELAPVGAAELAAELEATSADHLLKVSDRGIAALKAAGVIPVLLPGTAFTLGLAYAPARRMIDLGLPVALATDFNPGTCLIHSMLTIIALAVMKMQMTVEEAITAATLNAACALDLAEEVGSLEEGKAADLLVLQLPNYRQIPYFLGHNLVALVIQGGRIIYERRA